MNVDQALRRVFSEKKVTPVSLRARVTLANRDSGKLPDIAKLHNTYKAPILIDEVRFLVRDLPSGSGNYGPASNPGLTSMGHYLRASMTVGNHALTSRETPVWLMSPFRSHVEALAGNANTVTTTYAPGYALYRWRFPFPVFVREDEVLQTSLQCHANTNTNTEGLRVDIHYMSRVLPKHTPPPPWVPVPFVASYVGNASSAFARSNETDLHNPFNDPLHVQWITGRIRTSDSGAEDTNYSAGNSVTQEVELRAPSGQTIAGPLPWLRLFDARRGWPVRFDLPPKQRIQVFFNSDAGTDRAGDIGILGYRMERL